MSFRKVITFHSKGKMNLSGPNVYRMTTKFVTSNYRVNFGNIVTQQEIIRYSFHSYRVLLDDIVFFTDVT